MRRLDFLVAAAVALSLAGCGRAQEMQSARPEKLNTFDVTEPAAAAAAQEPRIAYSYTTAYALDGGGIAAIEAQHAALCDSLDRARCRIVSSSVSDGSDGDGYAGGEVKLIVDARIAKPFAAKLDAVVTGAGGRVTNRGSSAEDVTKQVIDVNARVAAKQALAERLVALIRTGGGSVGDLVAAEKAYADTQAELEAARGEQAALAQRVTMSDITLTYASRDAGSLLAPVNRAWLGAGTSLGWSLAGLLTFVVVAAPWVVLLSIVVWLLRQLGWRPRWPWRRGAPVPPAQ